MFIAVFTANMPDNCGAFFSDIALVKSLQKRGHTITLINCGEPKKNFAGGVQEGIPWKPQSTAGRELDQSQLWISPHFPWGPLVRKLNTNYRRPIIFTLHFAGAPNMFNFPGQITWKETFWQVNPQIPEKLVPTGFPRQVVSHKMRHPFIDVSAIRVENPGQGEQITFVNANMNKGLAIFVEIAKRMPEQKFLAVRSQQHVPWNVALDVPPNITWIDFSRDMKSLQEKTRILLVPSTYESFCIVAVEAMANGIPVLQTLPHSNSYLGQGTTEGMHEWIQPAGIGCTQGDAEDWVEKIRSLDDPEAQEERVQQVCEHVQPLLNTIPDAIQEIEQFARENPVTAGTQFKIQNAAPPREAGRVLTAIPQAPTGVRVGWQNGRLSFGRR